MPALQATNRTAWSRVARPRYTRVVVSHRRQESLLKYANPLLKSFVLHIWLAGFGDWLKTGNGEGTFVGILVKAVFSTGGMGYVVLINHLPRQDSTRRHFDTLCLAQVRISFALPYAAVSGGILVRIIELVGRLGD